MICGFAANKCLKKAFAIILTFYVFAIDYLLNLFHSSVVMVQFHTDLAIKQIEFFTKLTYFNFYVVDNRYQQRTSQFGRVIPRWASSLFTKVFFSIALVFLCIVHVSTSVNLFHLLFRAREWCSYPSASFGNSVHRRTNSHYTFI